MNKAYVSSIAIALLLCACAHDKGLDPVIQAKAACEQVKYNATIKPIIDTRCATAGCHDAGSPNGDFTSYPGVKAKVDNNTFKSRVIDQGDMPQGGPPLSVDTLNQIKCWLSKGAPND